MKYAADFRSIARNALKGKWGIAVVAGLIASLLGAVGSSGPELNVDSWVGFVLFSNFQTWELNKLPYAWNTEQGVIKNAEGDWKVGLGSYTASTWRGLCVCLILVAPCSLQDIGFLTRCRTWATAVKALNPDP